MAQRTQHDVYHAGGDSGIGRAVAVHFAREGADVAILYKDDKETKDADEVVSLVEKEGRRCLKFRGDVRKMEVRCCSSSIQLVMIMRARANIMGASARVEHTSLS